MNQKAASEIDVLVVGDPYFISRYEPLTTALTKRFHTVEVMAVSEKALVQKLAYFARAFFTGRIWPLNKAALHKCIERFRKEPATFIRLSNKTTQQIANRVGNSNLIVLQIFGMSSPHGDASSIRRYFSCPYVHYIDMTMAQVARQWPKWAPFDSSKGYDKWLELEGTSYRQAQRVFTFSQATRQSVISDYNVPSERVVAVGAAGHYDSVAKDDRTYGNRTIIFNSSDFERKGGDLVLAAFRIIRKQFPDATLRVVANTTLAPEDGIRFLNNIPRTELFTLMNSSDVVLAPSRMDVLPGFVCEAMNHGIVPVLSDSLSMNEMIQDGKEGYVVTPTTPENLAAHVIKLFKDESLLSSMGKAARQRVATDWNWDLVAERMADSLASDKGKQVIY